MTKVRVELDNYDAIAVFDKEDYDQLSKLVRGFRALLNKHNEVTAVWCSGLPAARLILWYRNILLDPSMVVDHIDGDPLNCCYENLRVATKAQNAQNRGAQRYNASGYKGVHKLGSGWCAQIQVNKVKRHLGMFNTAEEAAKAYNEAALLYHGNFAVTN